ncbi:MAG: hypothetical protein KVP17_003516 [Porospora cf. gigantea B]|uniref:uncharacterized protein n=1 Tax=Porospora cf. gigantea B TaxID=2853592 RepID=UPI003571D9DB|nr:MAG: hypothetical protein KVP17_003516 [Porospora cf. gigantea B]
MAKKKKKAKKKSAPEQTPFYVQVLAICGLVSSVLMFMTLGLRTWRVAPDVDFNWVNKKQLTVTTYTRTTFGLFTISFNGGLNVRTWSRITAITCSNLDAIKPVATAQSSLMSAACDSGCLSHYSSRCGVYRVMTSLHNFMLAAVSTCASISAIGSAYAFIFGIGSNVPTMIYLLTGLGLVLCWCYWSWTTFNQLHLLLLESQFPIPAMGPAAWLLFAAATTNSIMGIGLLIHRRINDYYAWQAKKQDIIDEVVGYDMPAVDPGYSAGIPPVAIPVPPAKHAVPGPPGAYGQSPWGPEFKRPAYGPPRPPRPRGRPYVRGPGKNPSRL